MELNDLTVIITRPQEQNRSLKRELAALGSNVISFPCIQINGLSQQQVQQGLSQPVGSYDLICFTSPNSVAHGLTTVPELNQLPSTTQLAAVGKTTAQALYAQGFQNIVVPDQGNDSESLLKTLAKQPLKDKTVLIIKGVGGRELLRSALQKRQSSVHTLDVYERLLPINPPPLPQYIDVIMFTSSESVENFMTLSAALGRPSLLACQTIVGHPKISEKVSSLGFKKLPIIATSPTDQDMLIALQQWVAT